MQHFQTHTASNIFSAQDYYDKLDKIIHIQSFACIWLYKGNQNEFRTHPKIKWLDGGLEPPTSGLPVHCSTT